MSCNCRSIYLPVQGHTRQSFVSQSKCPCNGVSWETKASPSNTRPEGTKWPPTMFNDRNSRNEVVHQQVPQQGQQEQRGLIWCSRTGTAGTRCPHQSSRRRRPITVSGLSSEGRRRPRLHSSWKSWGRPCTGSAFPGRRSPAGSDGWTWLQGECPTWNPRGQTYSHWCSPGKTWRSLIIIITIFIIIIVIIIVIIVQCFQNQKFSGSYPIGSL